MDALCAIDLDTIVPCYYISRIKKIPRIYDAHELFTEMKEVISRPGIYKTWKYVEKKLVPRFPLGYTVSDGISAELNKRYGVQYETIRNMPVKKELPASRLKEKNLFYQGAVNEGRGFENLIPAMKHINTRLVICGDGNFMEKLKQLIKTNGLQEKIELTGMLPPDILWEKSLEAYIAIAVPEKEGLNQYFALPNKFFDYIHAGLPQVTANYPEYKQINDKFEVAVLIDDNHPEIIAKAVNNLLSDDVLYNRLWENCLKARNALNWEIEEKKLVAFYKKVFGD